MTFEQLGGGQTHNVKSGVAHYLATDEDDAIDYVKHLLQFLPQNKLTDLPSWVLRGRPLPRDGARPRA